jgi:hypothetical protein
MATATVPAIGHSNHCKSTRNTSSKYGQQSTAKQTPTQAQAQGQAQTQTLATPTSTA